MTIESTADDGFVDAIRDILSERWPHHGNPIDVADDITATTDLIADAYAPRIAAARRSAERAGSEVRTYAERDRMLHALLLQAKKTAQLFLDGKERAVAVAEHAQRCLDGVRHKAEETRGDGNEMISIAEILPLLTGSLQPEGPRLPIVVGIQPDTRWTYGAFRPASAGDETPRTHYPLIGWAVVANSAFRTNVEPAFLVEGTAVTQTGLLRNGLILDRIL